MLNLINIDYYSISIGYLMANYSSGGYGYSGGSNTPASGSLDDFGGAGPTIPPSDRTSTSVAKDQAVNVNSSPAAKTNASGPFTYPIHNADRYQGRITFLPIEVNIPKFAITGENFRQFLTATDEKLKESESTTTYQSANDGNEGEAAARQYQRTGTVERTGSDTADPGYIPPTESANANKNIITYTPIPDQKIILNLPVAYIVNDAIGYDNTTELGVMGATGLNALERTGDMGSAIGAALGSATTSITDLFKQGMGANAARVAFSRGLSAAPIPAGLKAAGQIAARVIVNPNIRTTFRGVSIREYSFQFKFIPYSAEESRMIADIIRTFRVNAYPEAIYAGPVAIGYKYPNLFKIRIQYKEKDVGSKIKMCYLRNVQTSYNPTAASFHADGSPTEIDLTLSFAEHTTISRADIDSKAKSEFGGPPGGETSSISFDQGDGY